MRTDPVLRMRYINMIFGLTRDDDGGRVYGF